MTTYRILIVAALVVAAPALSGCSSTGEFLADHLPASMGGLPADAPPRPSDPRYAEYMRQQDAHALGGDTAKPDTGKK